MKIFFHIWWREVSAYFRTSMAYVTGFFFLAVAGFGFWNATARWAQAPSPGHFANGLFGSVWYWLAMLVVTPLLAMRLFAEENRTGTLETLLAAPVTETTIVLAKFASAFSLFLLLWAPTLAYGFLLRHCGAQYPAMPWGWVAAGYFGTALVGAFFPCLLYTSQLKDVEDRLRESAGLHMEVTDKAKERLIEEGTDPDYGARPLRRAIQRLVEDPMSDMVLRGEFRDADRVIVDLDENGKLTFSKASSDLSLIHI